MAKKDILQYKFIAEYKKHLKANCFFIHGEDSYLKQETLNLLVNQFADKQAREFDFEIFFADETSPEQVIDQLEQYPFFAQNKTIVYRDVHTLAANKLAVIADYVTDPNPSSKLLLTADKIDKRKKANKQIFENCVSVVCNQPRSSKNISGWLFQELKKSNIQMDRLAMNIFIEAVELDYQVALNELEKLIIKANGRKITQKDVLESVGYSRTHNVFELQNSLGNKDVKTSIKNYENLIENRESEVFILIMITNFFFQLWEIKAKQREGISDSEIKKNYMQKVFYSKKDDYLQYAKNYKYNDIVDAFELLLDTDTKLKTMSTVPKSILLEIVILKICT